MLLKGIFLAWQTIEILPVTPPRNRVVLPEKPPSSKLRKKQLDDVLECAREQNIALIWLATLHCLVE
jgi:hypothetical protein